MHTCEFQERANSAFHFTENVNCLIRQDFSIIAYRSERMRLQKLMILRLR